MKNKLELPIEFSGPAQLLLYTRYGDPREPGWENKWITTWDVRERFPWFPRREILIHKHFRPMLESAMKDLVLYNLYHEIRTFDGCFKLRNIKGSRSILSVHAWGAAIDLNSLENPNGSIGRWSEELIQVMVNNGIFCGQNWIGRKDPMHFAMVNG
ncbi:MAG: M15 family metallopeptidase [Flavipsychrobacter sp.]|nr:M15 family metallopeptidase [Flavipsychrobacter sp.]